MAEGNDLNFDPNSGLQYAYGAQQAAGLKTYEDPNAPFRMANIGGPQYDQYHTQVASQGGGEDPGLTSYQTRQTVGPDGKPLPNLQIPKGMPDPGLGGQANSWTYVPSPGPGKGAPGQFLQDGMQFYDPNYGWVTPSTNQNVAPTGAKKWLSMGANAMPYVAAGAATMGLGALAGPAFAPFVQAGLGAAQGMVGGGKVPGILAGAAGGVLGGMTGIPGGSTIGRAAGSYLAGGSAPDVSNPYSNISNGGGTTMNDPYNMSTGNPQDLYSLHQPADYTESINVTGQRDPWTSSATYQDPQDFRGGVQDIGQGAGSFLGQVFGNNLGVPGSQDALVNSSAITGIAAAGKQLSDSYKYPALGREAAKVSNPFGDSRQEYIGRLHDAYTNPTAVLNDPAHLAIQERQMAALSAKLGASGYMGSGLEKTQLADYLATSDNQFLGQEKDRLAQLSGSQFNPASAGNLIMQGGQLGLQSSSAAIDSLLRPITAYAGGTRNQTNVTNSNGGNSNGAPPGTNGVPGPGNTFNGKSLPAGASIGGLDSNGLRQVIGPAGQIIGVLGKDGSFYNNNPGRDFGGSSGGQEGQTGVLDPNTGLPWGQDAGSWDSNYTPPDLADLYPSDWVSQG